MGKKVLDTILDKCRDAMLSRIPIIILRTNDMEMIHRVIRSDRLVARICKNIDTGEYKPFSPAGQKKNPGEWDYIRLRQSQVYNEDHVVNVFYYTSADEFTVNVGENYGVPCQKDRPDRCFPELYVIPCPETADARKGKGRDGWTNDYYRYVDRYTQMSDDNTTVAMSCILMYGDPIYIPEQLERYCVIVDEPFPDSNEIMEVIWQYFEENGLEQLDEPRRRRIANALTGFRLTQAENLLRYIGSLSDDGEGMSILYHETQIMKIISQKKIQMLEADRVLELVSMGQDSATDAGKNQDGAVNADDTSVGGMGAFKGWLEKQTPGIREFSRFAGETGGFPCKGVLMCGVPGCGKSLAARATAEVTELPLLKLDIGKLMGKHLGESEHNLDKALKQAEAMSPCVLWVDEIEKGFGTADGESHEVTRRMFGSLLTWMQECREPVFIFATANNIAGMPEEFFRSGRFDELFSIFMPSRKECAEILRKQMEMADKRVRVSMGKGLFPPSLLETDRKAKKADEVLALFDDLEASEDHFRFMTGADIAKLVSLALRLIWTEKQNGQESMDYPIEENVWKDHLKKAYHMSKVYGDSATNLDSIAACYIRLLKNSFLNASDEPMFLKEDYKPELEEGKETYKVTIRQLTPEEEKAYEEDGDRYDLKMREELAKRMEEIGRGVEQSLRAKYYR